MSKFQEISVAPKNVKSLNELVTSEKVNTVDMHVEPLNGLTNGH